MSLPSISLKRPVLAVVMSIVIVLFGVIGFSFLGIREYPSVDPPIINVRTNYTGANADIVESQITEPLEKAINGIAGIRSITSSSNQGSSQIQVEFDLGVDLEAAANDVRDKVSQAVRNLPQDIDAPPVVAKADANSDAILALLVQSDSRNQLELSDYAANVLQERLQTIPGVSTLQIWGEKKYAMRLWLDPQRMASYNLTADDVLEALDRENVERPSGKISGLTTELTVKTFGRLVTEKDFNEMIIRAADGNIVRFQDIGEAKLGPENEETQLKESGVPMIGLGIIPQPGANYVEIADEFYKRYEQLKSEVPEDINLSVGLDNTVFIKNSIEEVEETLLISFLLVVLIIYLFFRDWLIAFRPLIDIPVSLIGTFFIMYVAGFSINVLTLLGIVLATGLVVDDGIVVTENIFKKMELGMDRREAARKGSEEIYFAVISTSVTLAIVFLPIVFLDGFVGRLFREFGIVVAGAVLISAFVSLTLTPVLNVYLSRKNPTKRSAFYTRTEPFFEWMIRSYRSGLVKFIRFKWLAFPIIIGCLAIIFFVGRSLKSELAPLDDRSAFRLSISAPEGTSYEYMAKYMDEIVQLALDSIPEKQVVISVTSPGFFGSGAANSGFLRVRLSQPGERERSQQVIADKMGNYLSKLTTGKAFVLQEPTISTGGGGPKGVDVQFVIQNTDFEKIRKVLPVFLKSASDNPVFRGVDVNLKFNKPELFVTINREKARELDVDVGSISSTLQLAYSGRRFGYFIQNGKQYQVIGQVGKFDRNEPGDLKSIYVKSRQGKLIQLDNLVQIADTSSPPQLYHFNRYKSATITGYLAGDKTQGEGIAVMKEIADSLLDDTFTTSLSGSSRDYEESNSSVVFAFLLAIVLVYLVLAAQFESFLDPVIILLTLFLALAGAVLSLWLFDKTLNIFSQIGIIMLVGLVTKNGILIVEFANHLRESGFSKTKSAIQAASMRLRPILMTSLATALGALPIALSLGSASKSRVSLGIVIVGGILFSLILTLFIIPAMYIFISQKKPKTPENSEPSESLEIPETV